MAAPALLGFFQQGAPVASSGPSGGFSPMLLMFFGDGLGSPFVDPGGTPDKRALLVSGEDRAVLVPFEDRAVLVPC